MAGNEPRAHGARNQSPRNEKVGGTGRKLPRVRNHGRTQLHGGQQVGADDTSATLGNPDTRKAVALFVAVDFQRSLGATHEARRLGQSQCLGRHSDRRVPAVANLSGAGVPALVRVDRGGYAVKTPLRIQHRLQRDPKTPRHPHHILSGRIDEHNRRRRVEKVGAADGSSLDTTVESRGIRPHLAAREAPEGDDHNTGTPKPGSGVLKSLDALAETEGHVGTDARDWPALVKVVEAEEPGTSPFFFRHPPKGAPWVVSILKDFLPLTLWYKKTWFHHWERMQTGKGRGIWVSNFTGPVSELYYPHSPFAKRVLQRRASLMPTAAPYSPSSAAGSLKTVVTSWGIMSVAEISATTLASAVKLSTTST